LFFENFILIFPGVKALGNAGVPMFLIIDVNGIVGFFNSLSRAKLGFQGQMPGLAVQWGMGDFATALSGFSTVNPCAPVGSYVKN
jgi:hypothetical protein